MPFSATVKHDAVEAGVVAGVHWPVPIISWCFQPRGVPVIKLFHYFDLLSSLQKIGPLSFIVLMMEKHDRKIFTSVSHFQILVIKTL